MLTHGMKIETLFYNWNFELEGGEGFSRYTVGEGGVIKIEEDFCHVKGDKHWYDVLFEDGHIERIFNPNQVVYVAYEEAE
ncbi:MAG: hypothetical protein FH762_18000 [Firmicutes bacterium]|nr:hypothetical protein [Bacillota bacterium]